MNAVSATKLLCRVTALVTVLGCQGPTTPADETPPPDPAEHLVPGAAREVQLIAQKAVLGFRADGAAYRAGYTTHDVTVQDGIVELVPHHVDPAGARVTGGAIGVETGGITRDDGTILGGASQARSNADGAIEIIRGAAVEVLTNREDGIQQEWKFASAPAGDGDLVVQVQVSGQRFVAANDSGLHFQSSAGLGFRYSHALWLDAAGHEWPIQAAWHDDHISITVPGEILADTRFPATLDPTITAEVAIDAPVNGSTGASSIAPAVAFDGTNYLVVWADSRLSRDEDIFATRVSQTGAILNSVGITVAAPAGRQLNPTVAFVGTQYVVAWEDFGVGTQADIAAAVVTTAGAVSQLGRVATLAANDTTPRLAANGAQALVVWNSGGDIRGSLFSNGAFSGAIAITSDGIAQTTPNVGARPGGNYLVAWSEGPDTTADLRGVFVTPAGGRTGAVFTISAGAGRQSHPAIGFDGTSYIVAFTNNNLGINLFATRVSTTGEVLDTHSEGTTTGVGGVAVSTAAGNQELESLSCGTGSCLVAWQDSRNNATSSFDIVAQRLSTTGALANDGPEIIVAAAPHGQFLPAVTTNGTSYFVVWQDNRDGNTQTVFGARVSAAGAVNDASGLMLVTSNNRETTPAMGRAGTTFGVVWSDSRSYGTDIEMIRFAGASKLDAAARPVSTATFAQSSPAVTASAGTTFFVVWNDTRNGVDRDIYGTRVGAAGNLVDTGGVAISTAPGDQLVPRVATSGTVTLVAWQDRRSGGFDIFGALIDNATGAVTVSDIVICNAAGDQGRPSVAFDAVSGQFLVVWNDGRGADPDIFGARVSAAGTVLDPNGTLISGAGNGQFAPAVAFLNGTGLVAWEDRRLDTLGDIFGARVALGGALVVREPSGFPISSSAPGGQNAATVAALSGSFLVAWTDGRNINATGTDIFGQQIGTSGVLNGADFAVSAAPENEEQPSLSSSTTGVTYIAYTKLRTDLQTVRVVTRTISASAGTGQACSTDAQCSTGFCVDTRCCDTACGADNRTDCQACIASKTGQPDGTCAVIPGPNRTICRNYASTVCDDREYCDGVSPDCPADLGRNQGQVCNSTTGSVCGPNGPPGPHGCP